MAFAHDTEVVLQSSAALINTLPGASDSGTDELAEPAQLEAYLTGYGFTGSRTHDDAELARVRDLRPRLRRLWTVDRDEAVGLVNEILARARALPRLVRHDGVDWHLHATADEDPLDVRMEVEAAMAVIDVIRTDSYDRMRICAAPDCDAVYVDLSRNRSKRYCDVGNCGNRANVTAYRARRAAGQG
ncbi:CGNR zinc finger domain-containing protein [Nakamurella flavida]|uniref:CGNR zinc finger domain-containing protein n=1 Tax=Nakamurella flavida TaxID=363630 RepID=A0A938YJB3_9ACTN|nr:CGNR zinc finger domain-containing protein [Nakamurella flavida]MBM9475788.1 CGNR zinc finger domain-containing protein [Nakamurella flavida]MDP9777931.1 putative RNA-binding Zn ribbon-like protein [Nakamurella flavida]